MSNDADADQTGSPRLSGWVGHYPILARELYRAPEPLTVRADLSLAATRYDYPRALFRQLTQMGAIVCVEEADTRRDAPDINHYDRTPVFEAMVEAYTDPLADREGWCADADCGRRSIQWPDDAEGPRCPCGAAIREEVGDDE